MKDNDNRPDPDELLSALKKEEEHAKRGKLKIFFGMCAGVGKTYDMLKSAHEALDKRIDVVIGYVETHKRPETLALLAGLAIIPRKKIAYHNVQLEEMDTDAILARKPELVLVDELAHTNAPECRHTKRYQDVLELLNAGIDVYTTLNVQHLESRADTVAQFTGSIVRETVPDSVFAQADDVEVVDISPAELLGRLAEGKVYTPERSQQAVQNFFRKGNLTALREMALRLTAERVDHQLRDYLQGQRITETWKSSQRLLVGLSQSPSSTSIIRWARRMAYAMNATWIAVYVESSTPLSDGAKEQLQHNIKLARELGAEIITTSDDDVATALIRTAHQQNATQILIGKPMRRSLFRLTLADKIIERSGTLDVYVVGDHVGVTVRKKKAPIPSPRSGLAQYVASSLIIAFVALGCYPFAQMLGYRTVSLILLLALTILPLRLGVGPVLLAATLSALLWDFLFIPPYFTFAVALPQDFLMLSTYFVFASVSSLLTSRVRAREQAIRLRESHATALYTLTQKLIKAKTQDEVATAAVENLSLFFNAKVALFFSEADGDIFTKEHPASTFLVSEKELGVAAWVYWNERKAGRYTDTLPAADAMYYPISGPRYSLGVIGLAPNEMKHFSIDQESLLQNFIAQIASTLEREQLNEMAKRSVLYAESEKLYRTLFNSISHELRTPVAAIMSASEGLLGAESRDGSLQSELAGEIHTAGERLNHLVGNLLDMTRLESGQLRLSLDWCDVRDIMNTALNILKKELAQYPVTVDVPDDVPLIKLDFVLIEQAVVNLLHNASLYTPPGTSVLISAQVQKNELSIIIEDNGPGFPIDAQNKLFDKFYRVPGTATGGTGLGLSIARGFVEAHGGAITAENKTEGGARFIIRIPVDAQHPIYHE